MMKRCQPKWQSPESSEKPKLRLYNSLTREKELFIPQFGNRVMWYSCGPTVYDAAHMGHARSYISFDIIRRVLSEYFSYDVFYVMNITDIDDKIIKRARQRYLFEQYVEQYEKNEVEREKSFLDYMKALSDVEKALQHYGTLLETEEDQDVKTMMGNVIEKSLSDIRAAKAMWNLEEKREPETSNSLKGLRDFLFDNEDILGEWQDKIGLSKELDNSIFFSLPAYWEEAFYKDMKALNVMEPNAVTRVTEYVPEIVEFVKKIMENGLAYESNGSVYFDTIKFNDTPCHFYGKLVPEAFGDLKKLQEGEGALSAVNSVDEKRNSSDFALWKRSKSGEPAWESPWGKGRPGWHIECSVMASSLLGESMDIHTGGFDLKFPHHDNELAQSEAYFNNDHWVRYFLHSGHLTISGCKMSKSLKNFITIGSALEKHTSRQIRLAFLLHSWKDTLDYGPQTLENALHYEKFIAEFLLTAKDSIRDIPKQGRDSYQKWETEENEFLSTFQKKQDGVHESLCDNIDTRRALENIHDLISASNVYINSKKSKRLLCNRQIVEQVVAYISKILKIFGASFGDSFDVFSTTQANEDFLMPHLRALADFRQNIRLRAMDIAVPILKLCDELRDDILPNLGVRLEDQEGLKAAIKLVDPVELAREKEIKLRIETEKNLEKEKTKEEQEALKEARNVLKKTSPQEMFLSMVDKYSNFDDKGIPTHDAEGKELSESQLKKVLKMYAIQEKKYEDYLKSTAST